MTIRRSGFGGAAVISVGVTLACLISACSAAPGESDGSSGDDLKVASPVYLPAPHQHFASCKTPPTTGCEGYSSNLGWFALTYDGTCPNVGQTAMGYYKGFTAAEFNYDAGVALQCAKDSHLAPIDEGWSAWRNSYSDDMNWSLPFCAYQWIPSAIGTQARSVESAIPVALPRTICDISLAVEVACSPISRGVGASFPAVPPKCMGACSGWGM